MIETKQLHSGSKLALAVFRQLFNGCGSTQTGELLALSKASAIGLKENKLSSSSMVDSVGHHILVCINFSSQWHLLKVSLLLWMCS